MSREETEISWETITIDEEQVLCFYGDIMEVDGIRSSRYNDRGIGTVCSNLMFGFRHDTTDDEAPAPDAYFYMTDFEVDEEKWMEGKGVIDKNTGQSFYTEVGKRKLMLSW